MHTTIHQDRLKRASPAQLDAVIAQIRIERPKAFHDDKSLADRVFFDQPARGESCKEFVRPYRLADMLKSA